MNQQDNQFIFTTIIHPPFVDLEKPDEQFYPQIGYNFATGDVKPGWAFISKDQQPIVPFYSAYVKKSSGAEFLVTGGAYSVENQLQTSNFCFRIQMHDHMEGHRIKYESWRLGLLKELDDGTEVQEQVSVIPGMNFARHNHKVFEILKPGTKNEYLYLVVGGQYISQDGWGILNQCEIYDEKSAVNQSGEQQWEVVDSMVNARTGFSGFQLNSKVYVFGGYGLQGDTMALYNGSKVEEFDVQTRKWKELKYKLGLGIHNNLGVSCLPVSDKHILLFGGSNGEKATDKIVLMDIQKKSIENLKSKTKLSIPRASAQSVMLKQVTVADSAQKRDIIVVLGGAVDEVSFDQFTIKDLNNLDIEFLGTQEFNNAFTGDVTGTYTLDGVNDIKAWAKTMEIMPVVTLIQ